MNAIEIQNLCKAYGERRAVNGLSLSIAQGEFFSLLGVNGAGKSSAIRMLTGVAAPDSGEAWIMGHSICAEPGQAKRVSNVSPQEPALAPKLSVRENLEFIAEIYGCSRSEQTAKVRELTELLDLGGISGKKAGTLSGGWQRRLSIAMALITEPKVLFLDEPTLGLDVLARRELWSMLRKLHGKATILMTTHYLEEAEALSDRIGILQRGRLRALGTPAELMAQAGTDNFEDAFVKLAGEGIA